MTPCSSALLRALFALCLSAFVFVFSSPATSLAQNLLTNPGFETGDLTGWTLGVTPPAIVADNGPSVGGTSAASWDVPSFSGLITEFSQAVPASAGTVYYWSFDQKSEGSQLDWLVTLGGQFYSGSEAPSWVTPSGSFTAPPGTTSIEFKVTVLTGFVQTPSFLTLDNFYLGTEQPVSVEGSTWGQIKSLYK